MLRVRVVDVDHPILPKVLLASSSINPSSGVLERLQWRTVLKQDVLLTLRAFPVVSCAFVGRWGLGRAVCKLAISKVSRLRRLVSMARTVFINV